MIIKIYKNKIHECDNCPCCGSESTEDTICIKGCYNGCSDIYYHKGEPCDKSC